MKRTSFVPLGLFILGLFFSGAARAQADFDFANIDTLMEDNALTEAANRYASVMLSAFPEQATRLGYASANAKLNDRSSANNALALNALRSVKEMTETISPARLSAANQADLQLLESALNRTIWDLEQNRSENDPLYYTEAFDAIYAVWLKKTTPSAQQLADLSARLSALPAVAQQAEKNLVQPPAYLSQLAMERAYYAYLSLDEITEFLLQNTEDEVSAAQIKRNAQQAKRAIKQLFDLFKKLSQEKDSQDFRLGAEKYARLLKDRYQITDKPAKLEKRLEKEFLAAQHNLAAALEPFTLETADEEVTVIDGLNNQPTVEPTPAEKKKKSKKGKFGPPSAQDFYKAADRVAAAPAGINVAAGLSHDAQELLSFFEQQAALPAGQRISFSVKAMPQFYAYLYAYLFVPPYGNQLFPQSDLFLRLPAGNKLARQEQLKRDFNLPVRKLLLTGELVPGRYYQTAAGQQLSSIRRLYPAASTANGWSAYAQQLARETGYLATDEELLFLAWIQYRRTAAALTEVRLQTKQYDYADALNFLTAENGFSQDDAERLLKEITFRPGEKASYIYGLAAIEQARNKYAKKMGKQFNLAQFHNLMLQAGNVPPASLEKEIFRLQEQADRRAKQKSLF